MTASLAVRAAVFYAAVAGPIMGHAITGLVAHGDAMIEAEILARGLMRFPLEHGFWIIDLGWEAQERLAGAGETVLAVIRAIVIGRSALVETDYFGGVGTQAATVYCNGVVISERSESDAGTINTALDLLGIKPGTCVDAFENLGLHRYRCFPRCDKDGE